MDGIVLLAKTPGITSFSSLFNVKKALNTNKVGHTGTLDSFAQGLLVVCTGRYTRLVSSITEFSKTYKAVISFGKETDTLEYTGEIVRTAKLPELEVLKKVINKYTGELLQTPPSFSAIHVDGHRASELARKGTIIEIPKRPVIVYKADLQDYLLDKDGNVLSCLVEFEVSKGTYIRALARDIANECGSAGYLSGLFRTKVGKFCVEKAAGFSLINDFTIEEALKLEQSYIKPLPKNGHKKEKYIESDEDKLIKKEVNEKIILMNEELAVDCGFYPIHLKGENEIFCFMNGKPIRKNYFNEYIDSSLEKNTFAVFSPDSKFCGLIKMENNKLNYSFVNN